MGQFFIFYDPLFFNKNTAFGLCWNMQLDQWPCTTCFLDGTGQSQKTFIWKMHAEMTRNSPPRALEYHHDPSNPQAMHGFVLKDAA